MTALQTTIASGITTTFLVLFISQLSKWTRMAGEATGHIPSRLRFTCCRWINAKIVVGNDTAHYNDDDDDDRGMRVRYRWWTAGWLTAHVREDFSAITVNHIGRAMSTCAKTMARAYTRRMPTSATVNQAFQVRYVRAPSYFISSVTQTFSSFDILHIKFFNFVLFLLCTFSSFICCHSWGINSYFTCRLVCVAVVTIKISSEFGGTASPN